MIAEIAFVADVGLKNSAADWASKPDEGDDIGTETEREEKGLCS
tara:strand:+ start:1853 stop:1984 length:132 start_codon:yes stop_codon:yes gene_type:complete